MSVTVLLADDHPIVRQGIRNLLEMDAGLSVVGEAEDGLQAVQLAEQFKPDVVIVDIMMPRLNGLETIRQITSRLPNTRCIVLSMQSADPYIVQALKAGAAGYVLKDSAPNEIANAIQQVLSGKRYLSPQLSEKLIDLFILKVEAEVLDPYNSLTAREREVLQLAAEGLSNTDIAEQLSISHRTVEQHRQNMMHKMRFNNQTDLIRFALKQGILPLDD
jgi:two-component system, NarL family, response regulator NreC